MQESFAHTVVWLLRLQAVLSVPCALDFGVLAGSGGQGLTALVGGGIGVVITAVTALRAGAVSSAAEPSLMMSAFYRAMVLNQALSSSQNTPSTGRPKARAIFSATSRDGL